MNENKLKILKKKKGYIERDRIEFESKLKIIVESLDVVNSEIRKLEGEVR